MIIKAGGNCNHYARCPEDETLRLPKVTPMKDLFRIYVLWHPESAFGQAAANAIAKHFDGLGMERDGVAYRVPVRFRSEAWDPASGSQTPAQIPWDDR
jgi:hypothetical protein